MIHDKKPVSVKFTPLQKQALAAAAERLGRDRSDLVRVYVEYCLKHEKAVFEWAKKNMKVEKKVLTLKK